MGCGANLHLCPALLHDKSWPCRGEINDVAHRRPGFPKFKSDRLLVRRKGGEDPNGGHCGQGWHGMLASALDAPHCGVLRGGEDG